MRTVPLSLWNPKSVRVSRRVLYSRKPDVDQYFIYVSLLLVSYVLKKNNMYRCMQVLTSGCADCLVTERVLCSRSDDEVKLEEWV